MSKYQKIEEYCVYYHQLPNKLVYFGRTKRQLCERWKPQMYNTTTLYPYIQQYGWENIKHIVIQDGLTKEQAKAIESVLIRLGKIDGLCINDRNGRCKNYKELHKERKEYYKERKEYYREYWQRPDVKKHKRECQREYQQHPEGKIYNRVKNYNYRHPDRIIETAKEAKHKYLETGYIPSYVKNDDLN